MTSEIKNAADSHDGLSAAARTCSLNQVLRQVAQGMGREEILALPSFDCCANLRHVAARDGEGFVAVLDEQLRGTGMRDNLFYLTKVDQEGAMAADNHRIAL
jgi:hypothetical protein